MQSDQIDIASMKPINALKGAQESLQSKACICDGELVACHVCSTSKHSSTQTIQCRMHVLTMMLLVLGLSNLLGAIWLDMSMLVLQLSILLGA